MDEIWQVLSVSLKVAIIATSLVMILSVGLAMIIARSRSKIIKLVELLIYLPMALPPVALGYGLLLILGRKSYVGTMVRDVFGVDISYTMFGAIIAAIAVSLGLGVRAVRVAVDAVSDDQLTVARLLGASPLQTAWHICLPQCRSAILGGTVLVFIRALSEFGATMVLAGNTLGETRTLALAIWVGMEAPGQERQCVLFVIIAVCISFIAVVAAEVLVRRSYR